MAQVIDLLGRNIFVDRVLQVVNQLSYNKKGSCFSIEGSWGIGKTFVLNELWKKLEAEDERYFLFHYNCWQHDYYEEPAVAIISAMKTSIKEDSTILNTSLENTVKAGYEFARDRLKEIAGIYLENKIGVNLINWSEEIRSIKNNNEKAEKAFDNMFSFSQAIEKVRKKMTEIAKERTIVLIVDELDRCIPQYAIKVLERLHHLFYGLENVVVIMAIDRSQLEHSVEEMFGVKREKEHNKDSMDIERYLKKFIDFSMILDYGEINERYQEKNSFYFDRFLAKRGEKPLFGTFLKKLFMGIDIRRVEKMIEKANIVHSVICNDKIDISVSAFEIFYEVLRFFEVTNMECVVFVNEKKYTDFDVIGEERVCLLSLIKSASQTLDNEKQFIDDFCGLIFWYFVCNFCQNALQGEEAYVFPGFESKYARELEVTKKYCEFREIIK